MHLGDVHQFGYFGLILALHAQTEPVTDQERIELSLTRSLAGWPATTDRRLVRLDFGESGGRLTLRPHE
jgi:hypothetical protein